MFHPNPFGLPASFAPLFQPRSASAPPHWECRDRLLITVHHSSLAPTPPDPERTPLASASRIPLLRGLLPPFHAPHPLCRLRGHKPNRSTKAALTRSRALRIETQLGVLRPGRFDHARISLGDGPQSAAQQRLLEAIKAGKTDGGGTTNPSLAQSCRGTSVSERGAALVTAATTTSAMSSQSTSTGRSLEATPLVKGISASQSSPALGIVVKPLVFRGVAIQKAAVVAKDKRRRFGWLSRHSAAPGHPG